MKGGMNYRNWGAHASRKNLLECANIADESSLDSIWVNDHIVFPPGGWKKEYNIPEEAWGMGNIIDPLSVMTFLCAATARIHFVSAVVVGPYRPALPTAKWLQGIQHLSEGRMLFGVGVGYFDEEFTALGIPKKKRGKITDELLDTLHSAFSGEAFESNGQDIIFEPKTKRPPFLIGGSTDIAIPRAIRRGDGWMPMGIMPSDLKPLVADFNAKATDAGRSALEVAIMKTLPLDNINAAVEMAQAYKDAGATHLVHVQGYDTPSQYKDLVDAVSEGVIPAL